MATIAGNTLTFYKHVRFLSRHTFYVCTINDKTQFVICHGGVGIVVFAVRRISPNYRTIEQISINSQEKKDNIIFLKPDRLVIKESLKKC